MFTKSGDCYVKLATGLEKVGRLRKINAYFNPIMLKIRKQVGDTHTHKKKLLFHFANLWCSIS